MFSQHKLQRIKAPKIILTGILAAGLSGCVTSSQETIEVSYRIPFLEKISQKNDSQKKGQVRITVEPYQYVAQKKPIVAVERNDFAKLGILATSAGKETYKITETPQYISDPEHISFQVKVKNQMNHILRLEGSVITMKSNKSIMGINKAGYKDFLNGVILPQEEKVFKIFGPKAELMQDGEKLTVSFFDVTTKTNRAGKAQARDTFRWTYRVNMRTETKQDQIRTYGKMLSPWEYNQLTNQTSH